MLVQTLINQMNRLTEVVVKHIQACDKKPPPPSKDQPWGGLHCSYIFLTMLVVTVLLMSIYQCNRSDSINEVLLICLVSLTYVWWHVIFSYLLFIPANMLLSLSFITTRWNDWNIDLSFMFALSPMPCFSKGSSGTRAYSHTIYLCLYLYYL